MHTEFDSKTAKRVAKRAGGSPHPAYKDDNGAICVWSKSGLSGGGVAVNAEAIRWLDAQQGARYVRVTNPRNGTDAILPLEEFPREKLCAGRTGNFYAVDPDDIDEAPF